ncbi:SGNH/GDSL hydrolase family protein [Paracoccus sp. JM45]|uniref:SGNH/GDSL hydrolase family protein n=1 Tax=Paracoccus sp. JM45 TaxID=2283626 RepID=UPI0016036833|nr:SGNH/GDSL hydrolase family protein [Paracoccus sp. JM45]
MQAIGDPDALDDLLDEINTKADLQNSTSSFMSRTGAVDRGQANLPNNIGIIFTREGNDLVIRAAAAIADDPLFTTSPYWGVSARYPKREIVDAKVEQADFDKALPTVSVNNASVPILTDSKGSVPLWLSNGLLDGVGMAPNMRAQATKDISQSVAVDCKSVPLFSDAAGKVPIWLSSGLLDGAGMAPNLRASAVQDVAKQTDGSSDVVPIIGAANSVLMWVDADGLQIPGYQKDTGTDRDPSTVLDYSFSGGASLSRARMKLAKVRMGVAGGKLKIAMMGDSWCEFTEITQAFVTRIIEDYALSGEGYRSPANGYAVGPATWNRTGWTDVDGSDASTFPYKAGADGQSAYTTGTAAAMTLAGVTATEMHIYDYQYGGTWRYQVDDGAWTVVTSVNTGAFRVTSITGLTDTPHTLKIDTTGNAGTVSMAGIYTTRDVNGVELLKMGNGGTTGFRAKSYAEYMAGPVGHMGADIGLIILGTNDYRTATSPPSEYIAGIEAIIAACRSTVPDMGFIIAVPPETNGTTVTPLSDYRDAAKAWAADNGHEYISFYDRWDAFAIENAHGLFRDDFHLNTLGGYVLASDTLSSLIIKG